MDRRVIHGESCQLTVEAYGAPPFKYLWCKDGEVIPDTNSSMFKVSICVKSTGVFHNSALGIYLFSVENKSKVVISVMRINGHFFSNKHPWGAPTDGHVILWKVLLSNMYSVSNMSCVLVRGKHLVFYMPVLYNKLIRCRSLQVEYFYLLFNLTYPSYVKGILINMQRWRSHSSLKQSHVKGVLISM